MGLVHFPKRKGNNFATKKSERSCSSICITRDNCQIITRIPRTEPKTVTRIPFDSSRIRGQMLKNPEIIANNPLEYKYDINNLETMAVEASRTRRILEESQIFIHN